MRRHFGIVLAWLLFSGIVMGTEQRDVMQVYCKASDKTAEVKDNKKKALCHNQSIWMIVKPHQHRYLFRSRVWLDAKTKQAYRIQSPELWSGNWAEGWDHSSFLILKYYRDGKENLLFSRVEPKIHILKDKGSSVKIRFDFQSKELSCAVTVTYRVGDYKFRLDVTLEPKVPIEKYALIFRGRVAGDKHSKKRLVIAGDQEVRKSDGKVKPDPEKVYRFIYTAEDPAKNRPYALVAIPGQADEVIVDPGSFYFYTTFIYPAKTRELTFLVYDCRDYQEGLRFFKGIEVVPNN